MNSKKVFVYRVAGAICASCFALAMAGCAGIGPDDDSSAALDASGADMLPGSYPYPITQDGAARKGWREFFDDPYLTRLIESAMTNNQEMNILLQEIAISRNEVDARSGEYLPFINVGAAVGTEKVGRFTRNGAVEENLSIKEGKRFPDPLPDFMFGLSASWELDIWNRLRSEKKAAMLRYLATREGRNFMQTHLIAEIADSYYELLALDNTLQILERMLELQEEALKVVRLQKSAGKATELAVRRFEAEVLKNQSQLFEMRQQIVIAENRVNFLAGRYPQAVERRTDNLEAYALQQLAVGQPSELLAYRPDVRRAELELAAAKLDVTAARARFYPTLDLSAAIGLQSFEAASLLTTPESLLYNLAGDVMMPLFNKRAINAAYKSASASQLQALYNYQRVVLSAYIDVVNQYARIGNIGQSHQYKSEQVEALSQSVTIANLLYMSARADYTEVLLTQRDALESRIELVELRQQQLSAVVNLYQALGGGYDSAADES